MTSTTNTTTAPTDGACSPWYMTSPVRMAEVVMGTNRVCLAAYGVKRTKIGLLNERATQLAAPGLADLEERPADEALQAALDIVADAHASAMDTFSMFTWAIDAVEQRVRDEVRDTITEHLTVRATQTDSELPAADSATCIDAGTGGPSGG